MEEWFFGPFERCFHEGYLCRVHRAVISFIITKTFVHLFCHGDLFYNLYINSTISTQYLDDDGTGVKPIFF